MGKSADPRLPVTLGGAADCRPGDFSIALPRDMAAAHRVGCACCGGRDPLAISLARAHLAMARGEGPVFHRVVVIGPASAASRVAAIVAGDPVTAARFRFARPTSA